MSTVGAYHEYTVVCSVHWGVIMSAPSGNVGKSLTGNFGVLDIHSNGWLLS